MTRALRRIVVVGASLAGLRAAEALRAEGYDGELCVVGEEAAAPYNRPPLSKDLLAGRTAASDVALLAAGDDLHCTWELGRRAVGLDVQRGSVRLDDGRELPYDGLVLACGSAARPLSAAGRAPAGVHPLRTLDDAARLRAAMLDADHVAVVGAGFIGCEVAATARGLGLEVTMIDQATSPMEVRLGPAIGGWAADLHAAHGVRMRLGVGVAGFEGGDRLTGVRLTDGSVVEAPVAVVGLGSVPCTDWLAGSGIPLDDGVVCDETLAVVGVPDVVAAGDVARWPYAPADGLVRIEHWSNAVEQAGHAARTLLAGPGEATPFATVPSFWSDQYDVHLRSIGLPGLADESRLIEGDFASGRFVVGYARRGRIVGAVTAGLPRRLAALRGPVRRQDAFDDVAAAATRSAG